MLALLLASALADDPRAQLLEAYAGQDLSAQHLVFVDTGLPAADLSTVPASLGALARALPDGDSLAIYGFSSEVREILPRTPIGAEGREALAARLDALVLEPGSSSDLGLALASARDRLREPTTASVSMILFMSDLCHEPPETSPYAFAGAQAGCGMIRGTNELSASFAALRRDRLMVPVSVTVGRMDKEGQTALFRVVGEGRTLAARPKEPGAWVENYAKNLSFAMLEPVVEREVERFTLSADVVSLGEDQLTLTLHSGLERLGLALVGLHFSGPELVPEKTALDLHPDATLTLRIVPPEPPFSPIPASRTLHFEGYLGATGTLEPRAALSRVGVAPGMGQLRLPLSVTWTQHYGPPPWAFALGLLAIGGGGYAALKRRRAQRGGGPAST